LIYGIDIDERCREISIPGVEIRIGSHVDQAFLSSVLKELGDPQIIIDDGSHHADHLSLTLEMLWPHLQDGGVYIIEDTHTSYWKEYGGGYLKNQTIVEFVKDAIDTIHQLYTRKKMPVRTEFLRDSLASITFFDSIIVLRKAKTTPPQRVSFE
jgi:cephalosporin hydroxylase